MLQDSLVAKEIFHKVFFQMLLSHSCVFVSACYFLSQVSTVYLSVHLAQIRSSAIIFLDYLVRNLILVLNPEKF